jgi:hypothetical protein
MSDDARLVRAGAVAAGADGALRAVFGAGGSTRSESASHAVHGSVCGIGCGACPGSGRPRHLDLQILRCEGTGLGAARPGDPVEVSVDAAGLVRAAGWTFGVPLAGLVTGAWMGSAAMGEGASIALGIVGFGFGIGWLLRSGRRLVPLLDLRVGRPAGVGSGMAGTNRRSG